VRKIVTELQERQRERGDTAQIRNVEATNRAVSLLAAEQARMSTALDLIMAHLGVDAPPPIVNQPKQTSAM
jgi:hypothetical protein